MSVQLCMSAFADVVCLTPAQALWHQTALQHVNIMSATLGCTAKVDHIPYTLKFSWRIHFRILSELVCIHENKNSEHFGLRTRHAT